MSTRYWIGVAHLKQAEAARAGGFCAFSHGRKSAVDKLSEGDRFIYYAPKSDFDGDPVQAFVALGTVRGTAPVERVFAGMDSTAWLRDAIYDEAHQVPVRPLLEELSFVRSPRHWGMAFRRSLFEVSEVDFLKISNAMRPMP